MFFVVGHVNIIGEQKAKRKSDGHLTGTNATETKSAGVLALGRCIERIFSNRLLTIQRCTTSLLKQEV